MKILVLTSLYPDPRQPTQGIFIRRWLQALTRETGWEFHVLSPRPVQVPVIGSLLPPLLDPKLLPPVKPSGEGDLVIYPRYPHLPWLGAYRQWRALFRTSLPYAQELARRHKYGALLGVHLYPDGAAAARLAGWFRLPLILSARGEDGHLVARSRFLRRPVVKAMRRARMLHAVSQDLARLMETTADLGEGSVAMIPNGVDTSFFKPGLGGDIRRELELPSTAGLLLNVGRLVPEKGQAELVEALALLPDHIHLLLVGDGPLAQPLRRLAEDRSVSHRLHLLGGKGPKEVAALYREADLFVLPSRRESCPNALLEAVASGLPAAASNLGSIPLILQQGRLGVLIKEKGPKALALAITRALDMERDKEALNDFRREWGWPEKARAFAAAAGRMLGWN